MRLLRRKLWIKPMNLKDKNIVITGAANGIGAAMAMRFAAEGARGLTLCDLDEEGAASVAEAIARGGSQTEALRCDVAERDDVDRIVALAAQRFGPIDLFCSNAGVIVAGSEATPISAWDRAWSINVIGHVHAANAVLPAMLERGSGYLLNTVSAAGMLTSLGAAPLCGDEACGACIRRMARNHLWRPRHWRQRSLSAGGPDQDGG
jgi:NAD(P)-dependent dehydrogenase (short-subunit alcohol dehydrogenase family)